MPRVSLRIDRRRFVTAAAGLPAASAAWLPAGGFAAGSDRLRIGLVGCGGRGTGAVLHAAAAWRGVTVTALADAFSDQIESSVALLAARAGSAFACPPERRFVGLDAWRQVVESDVDLVILATPPAFRPLHAAAAVEAGKHVWCEKPGAVDAAGVRILAAASAAAAARGLSFASGLAVRHDVATAARVARIRDGAAGRPRSVTVRSDIHLPWFRPPRPGWTAAEAALRNWISHARWSGGHFVEHHVAAIDKALWVMGDADPVAAIPLAGSGDVRLVLPGGRHIDAALRRRAGATGLVEERVHGTAGVLDLAGPEAAATGERHPLRIAMRTLVDAIRPGRRLDEGPRLCRATWAAIAGRMALEAGSAVECAALAAEPPPSTRPLQSFQA